MNRTERGDPAGRRKTVVTDGGKAVPNGGERDPDDPADLPDPVVDDLRDSERRRHVFACLEDCEGSVPVSDLARRVAARERDEAPDDVPEAVTDDVRTDVFQRHLPKLTATEVVRYDSLVGTVELATEDERLLAGPEE